MHIWIQYIRNRNADSRVDTLRDRELVVLGLEAVVMLCLTSPMISHISGWVHGSLEYTMSTFLGMASFKFFFAFHMDDSYLQSMTEPRDSLTIRAYV